MRTSFGASVRTTILASAASLAIMPAAAFAQDDVDENTIVVTGTLIRGVEATGSQTIDLGEEEIAASGASTPPRPNSTPSSLPVSMANSSPTSTQRMSV